MPTAIASRPIEARYGVILLWLSLVFGIANWFFHIANTAPDNDAQALAGSLSSVVVTAVGAWITWSIGMGKKWALIAFTLLLLILLPMSFYDTMRGQGISKEFPEADIYFGAISDTLSVVGICFLYLVRSREWFFGSKLVSDMKSG